MESPNVSKYTLMHTHKTYINYLRIRRTQMLRKNTIAVKIIQTDKNGAKTNQTSVYVAYNVVCNGLQNSEKNVLASMTSC